MILITSIETQSNALEDMPISLNLAHRTRDKQIFPLQTFIFKNQLKTIDANKSIKILINLLQKMKIDQTCSLSYL